MGDRNNLYDAGEWDLKSSSALTYDAEKVSDFIENLRYVNEKYNDKAGMLAAEYDHYRDNQTFVGRAADASKYAIDSRQKGCLHKGVYNIEKAIYDKYCNLDDMFKVMVDPSPKARINTDVIENVKCDYVRQAETSDIVCRVLENSSRYLEQEFGYLGHVTQINYNGVRAIYDKFSGNGGFLDKCVKRMEDYETEALTSVKNSQLDYMVSDLQSDIIKAAGSLDDMKTYDPSMTKISISLVALSASIGTSLGVNEVQKGSVEDVDIKKFLDNYGIKVNKLETKDGYFIIDKSIAEMLEEAGVDPKVVNYEGYDDWYITGLTRKNGKICYSMIKVRESMDDQGNAGTSVVFDSMIIDPFKEIIANSIEGKEIDERLIYQVNQQIELTVYSDSKCPNRWDQDMIDYFRDAHSEGSYLIADFVVDKVAHDTAFSDGTYKLPYTYDQFDTYAGQDALNHLEDAGVYDKEKNTITIKNPDSLTYDERNALLLITTGDKDAYAFAGENQFHADAYNRIPYFESHAIKSDAGVGEGEAAEGFTGYEILYKKSTSPYYISQYNAHKGAG